MGFARKQFVAFFQPEPAWSCFMNAGNPVNLKKADLGLSCTRMARHQIDFQPTSPPVLRD
jgi:hypothetical protein